MKPHYAAATSIFSLCLYSAVGILIHIGQGNVDWMVIWGGLGILIGAQLGVFFSNKVSGMRMMQMLSVILIMVGVKLFLQ
ncbi:MAG TPA: TSUP family transporter [Bacillales bacterium]|nr:TSUP family transporter [Bacillales bacterium]